MTTSIKSEDNMIYCPLCRTQGHKTVTSFVYFSYSSKTKENLVDDRLILSKICFNLLVELIFVSYVIYSHVINSMTITIFLLTIWWNQIAPFSSHNLLFSSLNSDTSLLSFHTFLNWQTTTPGYIRFFSFFVFMSKWTKHWKSDVRIKNSTYTSLCT